MNKINRRTTIDNWVLCSHNFFKVYSPSPNVFWELTTTSQDKLIDGMLQYHYADTPNELERRL